MGCKLRGGETKSEVEEVDTSGGVRVWEDTHTGEELVQGGLVEGTKEGNEQVVEVEGIVVDVQMGIELGKTEAGIGVDGIENE